MAEVNFRIEDGRIAVISFARAPVNALTVDMLETWLDLLARCRDDEQIAAVIVSSDLPGRFCAGLDLAALHRGEVSGAELVEKLYVRMTEAQYQLGKPSIAAINGTARGGGMTLAISCDVIVCSDTATFGYPEVHSGVLPSIHFHHLPPIIGKHRAFELLFSGRSFDASEARELGLVSRVTRPEALMDEALALANSLTAHPAALVRAGRAAFKAACEPDYRARVRSAADNFGAISADPIAREGIAAFVGKRQPRWRA